MVAYGIAVFFIFVLTFGECFRFQTVRAQREATRREFWPFDQGYPETGIPIIDAVMSKKLLAVQEVVGQDKTSVNKKDSNGKNVMHLIGAHRRHWI